MTRGLPGRSGHAALPEETATAKPTEGVAAAMIEVLAAEREAAEGLERCRAESRAALEAARVEAARIAARSEALVQAIHGRIERVAALRCEIRRRALAVKSAEPDAARLAAAVARLAARLCGAEP